MIYAKNISPHTKQKINIHHVYCVFSSSYRINFHYLIILFLFRTLITSTLGTLVNMNTFGREAHKCMFYVLSSFSFVQRRSIDFVKGEEYEGRNIYCEEKFQILHFKNKKEKIHISRKN